MKRFFLFIGNLAASIVENVSTQDEEQMIVNETLPLEKQHLYCPKDKNSWCKFWKDKLKGTSTYDDSKRLPEVFMEELDPIFIRLSKDDLLSRCLKGMTQNQKEAVNGQLWSKCSKTKFCGARRVRIAACETIAVFNTGAGSKAVTMELRHVTPRVNTMKAFTKQDQSRVKSASQKISSKYRKQRQNLRAKKKGKGDDTTYHSGGFSLSSHPDKCVAKKRKERGKSTKGQNSERTVVEQVEVVFIQPEYEFTVICHNFNGPKGCSFPHCNLAHVCNCKVARKACELSHPRFSQIKAVEFPSKQSP